MLSTVHSFWNIHNFSWLNYCLRWAHNQADCKFAIFQFFIFWVQLKISRMWLHLWFDLLIAIDSMNMRHKIIKKTLYCSGFLCNIVKYRHGNLSMLMPILVLYVMRSEQHFTFTRTANQLDSTQSRNSVYFIATTLLANVVFFAALANHLNFITSRQSATFCSKHDNKEMQGEMNVGEVEAWIMNFLAKGKISVQSLLLEENGPSFFPCTAKLLLAA